MIEFFSYAFLVRALAVGMLTGLCAALLGVVLVLKRYSMIGDGLSHVAFGALSIALALGIAPLYVALPVVVAAAFLLLRLRDNGRLKADAAIALISSSSLAIGVIVTSVSGGVSLNVYDFMFGSVLATTQADVAVCAVLAFSVLAFFIIFYNRLFAVTFDEEFASASGVNTGVYNSLIAALTAGVIVVGMRIVGTLLISSLVIFPALTAMRVFRSFKGVVICAAIVSVACVAIGIFASFALSLPAGASIVAANLLAFLVFSIIPA